MPSESSRIGVFGGTFDPIHIGHLMLCQEAQHQLSLDHILLLPAADPPHKQEQLIAPIAQRIQMLELAISDVEYLRISFVDVERPGPHYSVETMQILQEQYGRSTQLYFLIGLDSLRDLPTWYKPEWLVDNCQIVTFERGGIAVDWGALESALPGVRSRVSFLQMPELEIASSDIRQRIRNRRPIRYHVLPQVAGYIRQNGLYTSSTAPITSLPL